MSKQTGLIRLDGKIGGISFYRTGGEDLARVAKGPSKERILTDLAFVRTRENNMEFGGSAKAAKALRLALVLVIQNMADRRLVSRLTKLFKEINSRSTGTRGQRPVTISANRTILENLDFDIHKSFSSVFNAPFTATNLAARNQATIIVPAFIPVNLIAAPAGATHFRLLHAIGVVSDYVYNTTTRHYEASDPALNSLGAASYSAIMPINSTPTSISTLNCVLPGTPAPTMTATVSVAQCIGIEFYQHVGASDYLLAQGNCMKVIKVF